jgi:hypothetical protein
MENTEALRNVLLKYGVPDPKIVGKLPKGGRQLDFVGHADVTKFLLEIDPNWSWVPIQWDNGRPAIHVENGIATMWGELRVLGQARLGVGSVEAKKPDLDKELVSDFLRNAAMRFGICLSLWTKQEWDDIDQQKPAPKPALRNSSVEASETVAQDEELSAEQRQQLQAACGKAGIDPAAMAANAGLDWTGNLKNSDIPALRAAFKELKTFKEGN